jgi:hypothetical protein
VTVRVDQAGHDPLARGVDHLHVLAILELDVGRQRAHALDAVAFDDDRIVARRRGSRAVDQVAVANDERLLSAGGHVGSPPDRVRLEPTESTADYPRRGVKQTFKSTPSASQDRALPD